MSAYIEDRVAAIDERDLLLYYEAIKKRLQGNISNYANMSVDELLRYMPNGVQLLVRESQESPSPFRSPVGSDTRRKIEAVKLIREHYGHDLGIKDAVTIWDRLTAEQKKGE